MNPGLQLFQEMRVMREVGMTPMQIIQGTTKWAAELVQKHGRRLLVDSMSAFGATATGLATRAQAGLHQQPRPTRTPTALTAACCCNRRRSVGGRVYAGTRHSGLAPG